MVPSEGTTGNETKIELYIERIAGTTWGQTTEGQKVVKILRELAKKGLISIKDTGSSNTRAYYNSETNIIVVDDNIPEAAIPGRLAHEGTHALQDSNGSLGVYDLSDERDAFDNAYEVDVELKSPIQDKPTDIGLESRYPRLTWPFSYRVSGAGGSIIR